MTEQTCLELDDDGFEEIDFEDDDEPDFTLDDLEWEEEYPELSEDRFCPFCGKEYEDFSDYGCPACDRRVPID